MKPFAPFSPRQLEWRERAQTSWLNVAEGAKRSGKNILLCRTFCEELEYHPDTLHLIAGYTIGNAAALIWKSDDLGVERYFYGRCHEGKYEDKPCYVVHTATGKKIILKAGGNNVRSQDAIAGYTFGTAYVTEANRCEESFIREVFMRTMSSRRRKIFHDLNPKSESHWYYHDVLAHHVAMQEADPEYGFNYGHFTMADNMSMSDDQIRAVIRSIPKGTYWYSRDILGRRVVASGLVYGGIFEPSLHVTASVPRHYSRYICAVDYGTRNNFVALLFGLHNNIWYCADEFVYSGRKEGNTQKNSEMYRADLEKFLGDRRVERIIIDPSAADFRVAIGRKYVARLADNDVDEGIRAVADALHFGLVKINDCCIEVIRGFERYAWDEKLDEKGREKPAKSKDDEVDAFRYFVHTTKIVRMHRLEGSVNSLAHPATLGRTELPNPLNFSGISTKSVRPSG